MAKPLYTPRVNNNDDTVQVVSIHVAPGDPVKRDDLLAEVETDKSIVEVLSEFDGFVLEVRHAVDDRADVGSILMWIGDSPDEPIPEAPAESAPVAASGTLGRPTAKALALLRRHGLTAEQVPASAERLSAADVEAFVARKGQGAAAAAGRVQEERLPDVPGERVRLSTEEQGMLATVSWHRDYAAAAYLEIEYDPQPWETAAAEYASQRGLMLSPLLSLMAYRLVQLAVERPKLNSTIVGGERYQYSEVNLGFTVQAGDTLYLTVTRQADTMDAETFIRALGEVQRHAMGHKLKPNEAQGATLAFSSMARWKVTRHMPILPPQTSLMIAHAATGTHGKAVLGVSYDHRVLSGFDAVKLLMDLARPPRFD